MKHATLHAIKLIEEKYGDSDESILLAGHNSAGFSLLKLLIGEEGGKGIRKGLENTGGWMVERQEDGTYELKIYNDKVWDKVKEDGQN